MNRAYPNKINWQNSPSTSSALGATNLNKMDTAIYTIDGNVVALDSSKASITQINPLIKSVSYNNSNGELTFTHYNDTTTVIDTTMEKIVTNFSYNSSTQSIDLTLTDGTTQSIDISSFVTNVDFEDSNTIQFTVDGNGKTVASVINGSITGEKLETNFLANCQTAETNAENQANSAKRYAVGGVETGDTTDNAKYYKEQAEIAKTAAETARDQAQAIVGIGIATDTVAGLVKGGGDVSVNANGSMDVDSADNATVDFTEASTDTELTTGSTLAVLIGLIKKKFNTIVTALAGKIGTDKIVNSLLSTDTSTVLSGPMGKALKEQLDTQNNNLNNLKGTIAWTNVIGSGVAFTPQSITLNASDYVYIEIYYVLSTQSGRMVSSGKLFKTDIAYTISVATDCNRWREVTWSAANTITFDVGHVSSSSDADNTSIIPMKIIGYK